VIGFKYVIEIGAPKLKQPSPFVSYPIPVLLGSSLPLSPVIGTKMSVLLGSLGEACPATGVRFKIGEHTPEIFVFKPDVLVPGKS
jgi:hypothetical protein